jgi:hypothetical protein
MIDIPPRPSMSKDSLTLTQSRRAYDGVLDPIL